MKPEKNDIFALAEDQHDQINPTGFFSEIQKALFFD